MIVADTSALVSLGTIELFDLVVEEFDVHTTTQVMRELESTAEYEDVHDQAAATVLDGIGEMTVHDGLDAPFQSSRVDVGEASCLALAGELDSTSLITDDLRALAELQAVTTAEVAISPIVLKALVKRERLSNEGARRHLDRLTRERDWVGTPIYHRARRLLFDDGSEA